jgi:hypothetical protein
VRARLDLTPRTARLVAALAACAVLALPASRAAAGPLPGPSVFGTGFVADSLFFEYPSAALVPDVWYQRMRQVGSRWQRIGAYWGAIQPTRPPADQASNPAWPGYDWTYLDRAVRAATASHQRIMISLVWPPTWALGPGFSQARFAHTWRPDPRAFGRFASLVAKRYSGRFPDPLRPGRLLPRVGYFQALNEPNLEDQLAPQWTRQGSRWVPASPGIYRILVDAAYRAVKAVQPGAEVLAAGLAPYGDGTGGLRMAPVQFLSELLCLHGRRLLAERCPSPARFDALDIHPYSLTPTLPARNPLDVSAPDLGRLQRVVRAAQHSGRLLPRGRKGLWVTEIAWDSNPPDPRTPISLALQARYVALAFYVFWRQGVTNVFWAEVRDPGGAVGNLTGSGLFFANGARKPGTVALGFPFVAVPAPHGRTVVWGRAPRTGAVVIQQRRGRRWVAVLKLRTTHGAIFYARWRSTANGPFRAVAGRAASYPFTRTPGTA